MQPTSSILLIAGLFFLLLGLGFGQQQEDLQEDVAPRRPAAGRRPPRQRQGASSSNNNNNPGASVSGSMALTGPSLGAAMGSTVEGSAGLELRPAATGAAASPTSTPSGGVAGNIRPATANPAMDEEEELTEDGAANQRPMRKPADRKRRPSKRPRRPMVAVTEEESRYQDEEDESCEEDDDDYQHGDYGNLFESMAGGPMRQFGRLMKSAFNRGMSMGSAGDNMASASAFSSPGLSRMSSSVSNNGQTRGIVSETRNGRTRTRTFGQLADNEEVAYDDDY